MRSLLEFTPGEWLRAVPLGQGVRQLRNDLLLARYRRQHPGDLPAFLDGNRHLGGKDIAVVIAFEQPWALEWQLGMARRHLPGVTVLVFDNSRTAEARKQIARVCAGNAAPYFSLPAYRTRHVNRSHGMAMSWVYHNVIYPLEPRSFGYLDHDLIPVRPIDVAANLVNQPVFGMINQGESSGDCWNLWAGYCFFDFAYTRGKPVNFLYDFSRDLDTGGRNWPALYRPIVRTSLRFATRAFPELRIPGFSLARPVEFIDDCWIHIGGISYNDNFEKKREFFEVLRTFLDSGASLDEALEEPKRSARI